MAFIKCNPPQKTDNSVLLDRRLKEPLCSNAEYYRDQMLEILDSLFRMSGGEVSLEAGIITVKYPDGSVLDFTEPKVIKEAD